MRFYPLPLIEHKQILAYEFAAKTPSSQCAEGAGEVPREAAVRRAAEGSFRISE